MVGRQASFFAGRDACVPKKKLFRDINCCYNKIAYLCAKSL